jgi:hypothetical protein
MRTLAQGIAIGLVLAGSLYWSHHVWVDHDQLHKALNWVAAMQQQQARQAQIRQQLQQSNQAIVSTPK